MSLSHDANAMSQRGYKTLRHEIDKTIGIGISISAY